MDDICFFCKNKIIYPDSKSHNYSIHFKNIDNKKFHNYCYQQYQQYQKHLFNKLNNFIDSLKTKSNAAIIKFILIDEKLKLSDFEKECLNNMFNSCFNYRIENNKNNNVKPNYDYFKENNLDDNVDNLIKKLNKSSVNNLNEKLLTSKLSNSSSLLSEKSDSTIFSQNSDSTLFSQKNDSTLPYSFSQVSDDKSIFSISDVQSDVQSDIQINRQINRQIDLNTMKTSNLIELEESGKTIISNTENKTNSSDYKSINSVNSLSDDIQDIDTDGELDIDTDGELDIDSNFDESEFSSDISSSNKLELSDSLDLD
jgi:hypothetical protein